MRRLHLTLSAEEERTLDEMSRKHPLPRMRERAGALLKIFHGAQAKDVAAYGLLQIRCKQSVSAWVHRYNRGGLGGLYDAKGRGRKPSFSPYASTSS